MLAAMTPSLSVFVQCPAVLRPGFERCKKAIESSDIGTDYTCVMQRPGDSVFEHFLHVLDCMGQSDTELVVRLEDDIDVNRHFVHNVTTWPTLHDARFGIGWLFDPGGRTYTTHDRMYQRPPTKEFWEYNTLAYSLAGVMWRRDIPVIRDSCARWYEKHGGDAQDIALSVATRALGKLLAVHAPSLVEHLLDMPSTLKHQHNRHATSCGAFYVDWWRGETQRDRHGRTVEQH